LEISFAAQVINIVVLRQAGAKGSSWHSFHLVVMPCFNRYQESTELTEKPFAHELHCSCTGESLANLFSVMLCFSNLFLIYVMLQTLFHA